MSDLNVDEIRDAAGSGAPDFPNGLSLSGGSDDLTTYKEETVAMSATITGTAKFTRVGNVVTVTGTGAWTWSSASSVTSTEAVSADFRPTASVRNLVYVDSGQITTVAINTNGTIYIQTNDGTFALVAGTSTGSAPTFSYIIT